MYQLIFDAFAGHTCYSRDAKQQSVNAMASGLESLGSSPGQVYCVVFEVDKTLNLSKASPHPCL